MIELNDRVVFTTSHYRWRLNANAWPSREEFSATMKKVARRGGPRVNPISLILRTTIRGTVTAVGDNWARVLWDDGRGSSCHFLDNLEVM